jgi:hypothetical protein
MKLDEALFDALATTRGHQNDALKRVLPIQSAQALLQRVECASYQNDISDIVLVFDTQDFVWLTALLAALRCQLEQALHQTVAYLFLAD